MPIYSLIKNMSILLKFYEFDKDYIDYYGNFLIQLKFFYSFLKNTQKVEIFQKK